jgi:hypothetical protein
MGYPGKGLPMPDNNGEDGMPDFGAEKGMANVFESMFDFKKPRRENDPNRKVGRDALYGRLNMDGQYPDNQ